MPVPIWPAPRTPSVRIPCGMDISVQIGLWKEGCVIMHNHVKCTSGLTGPALIWDRRYTSPILEEGYNVKNA